MVELLHVHLDRSRSSASAVGTYQSIRHVSQQAIILILRLLYQEPDVSEKQDFEVNRRGKLRYCRNCKRHKPPRAHHCKDCKTYAYAISSPVLSYDLTLT